MRNLLLLQLSTEIWGIIFCLIFSLSIFLTRKEIKKTKRMVGVLMMTNSLLLFSDVLASGFDGTGYTFSHIIVELTNFGLFMYEYLLAFEVAYYFYIAVRENGARPKAKYLWIVGGIQLLAFAGLIVSQFTGIYYSVDSNNYYQRGPYLYVGVGLAVLGILHAILCAVKYRNYLGIRSLLSCISLIVFSIIMLLIQMIWYGFSFLCIGITISMLLIYFAYEKEWSITRQEQQKRLTEAEYEVLSNRNSMLMIQMKPYFISRSLNSIREWCDVEPAKAVRAIDLLNAYIRDVFILSDDEDLIPIEREMEMVSYYLNLNDMHDDHKIHTEIDIKHTEIKVPPLTILPIVEFICSYEFRLNSVSGNLKIHSEADEDFFYLYLEDDGSGIANEIIDAESDFYREVEIVRQRLDLILGASFRISSEKGKGCHVLVMIPKKTDFVKESLI